ncbi:MAG: S8 family serine peptidase [Actinomycetota bacterium]|nr:S8 family serine peptidase [Actinomycetota bacterium]
MAAALGAAVLAAAGPASAEHAPDPRQGEQWALATIGAPAAWGAGTGAGITIAVVDTGVDFGHKDLNAGGKLLPGRNILDPSKSAQDDNGHGTHVAGIAAAATGNHEGIAGTAPNALILPVKVLGSNGSGNAADVAAGIRWAAGEGADRPRAQVINLSLGSDLPPLATLFGSGLEEAIADAWSKGVVVVLAAGNSFLFASSSGEVPALVVTATTREDQFAAAYASRVGSAVWGMAAPGGAGSNNGDDIISTYRPNTYRYLFGTSMAAPHVAGAAAVLRGLGLTPQQTVDRLLATAKDVGPAGPDTTFGAGRLDLACAVGRCGSAVTTTTAPPTDGGSAATQPGGTSGPNASQSPAPSGSGPTPSAGGSAGAPGGNPPGASGAGRTAARATGGRAPAGRPSALASPSGRAGPPTPAATPSPTAPGQKADEVSGDTVPLDEAGSEEALGSGPSPGQLARSPRSIGADEEPRRALVTAAGGLLLLVALSGLALCRSRRSR